MIALYTGVFGGSLHTEHQPRTTGRVLKWSLALTVAFVVVEFSAGLEAHSLALLSDAGHNLTDALALLLAWFAFRFEMKPPDEVKTYGYHRAGVLAAFVNALALMLLSGFIFYESYHRLMAPPTVNETTMILVATLGLLVNGAIMLGLRRDSAHDLNIRSAFLHMMGDALGSIAIIVGAIGIRYTGWQHIDPILSILIALLIIWTAWDITKESLNILLEGLPKGMKLNNVLAAMQGVDGVLGVHDLHIWSLGSNISALSCHVLIKDLPPSESEGILKRLNDTLRKRYGINHTTVQFERTNCCAFTNGCAIPYEPPS
ncbi:MAG: cation diffusion facilitator family transporter [Acidobacteriales bacterium]|nr:cation diffusion facilitator family transporter [Terriglobales bacterium]